MKKITLVSIIYCFVLFVSVSYSQIDTLKHKILKISNSSNSTIGIAILGIEDNDSLSINSTGHFPLQSVFKFPLALAILHLVDEGKYSLYQKINFSKADMLPKMYSPLREKYPDGYVNISLAEILSYTVSLSDNISCDKLFKLAGGTGEVNKYIHNIGIKNISIAATEKEMHAGWNVQFKNWCEPMAMARLLKNFYLQKNLSKSSTKFLWKVMTETSTGQNRIKGLLPAGTVVAHKTGTSDTNDKGITAATNDVGIVTLPNGKHYAIVVFVSNSKDNDKARDKSIAEISSAVWNYFTAKKP